MMSTLQLKSLFQKKKEVVDSPLNNGSVGLYINLIEAANGSIENYKLMAMMIRTEFGANITEDDIINHYAVDIAMEDAYVHYSRLGFC